MNGAQAPSSKATYRILRELGARAQKTYAAVREPNELVAVQKFARAPASVEREARALAKNWHPNLARVRHVEHEGDELVVATDFIDGVTLADLYAAGAAKRAAGDDSYLPLPVLARITVDVLGGLQGMHGLRDEGNAPLGAFHGAVCPSNVVIGKDGVARLVALFRPRPVRIVTTSESLCYAAPEALEPGSAADPRTDLYGAAVLMWEGVLGKKLHDETQPSRVLQRQREEEIAWKESDDPTVVAVGRVVLRALSFDPVLRYRSAWELATELRKATGTKLAPGSLVAQKVVELAGERIRTRRLELEPAGARKTSTRSMPRVTPTPAPVSTTAKPAEPPKAPVPTPKPAEAAPAATPAPAPAVVSKAPPVPAAATSAAPKKPPPPVPKKPPVPAAANAPAKVDPPPVSDPSVQDALVSVRDVPEPKSDPAVAATTTSASPDPALAVTPAAGSSIPEEPPAPERTTDAGVDVPVLAPSPPPVDEISTVQAIAVFFKKPIPARTAARWVVIAAAIAMLLTIVVVVAVQKSREPIASAPVVATTIESAPPAEPTSLVTSTLPVETATPPPPPPPVPDEPEEPQTAATTSDAPPEPEGETTPETPTTTAPAAAPPPPVQPTPAPAAPRKPKPYEPLGI